METNNHTRRRAAAIAALLLIFMYPVSMFGEPLLVLVVQVEKDIGDLTASADLWGSNTFLVINREANTHIAEALRIFTEPQPTLQQKMIVAFALQRLSKDEYIATLGKATDLYAKGHCPSRVMELLILPGFEWSTTVIENYRDEKVVRILNAVKKSEQTSDRFKKAIDSILSGQTWEKARVFIANQPKAKPESR